MKNAFEPAHFGHLSDFVRAYLHEDYKAEHGTPEGAVDDFCKHATHEQLAAVTRELHAFLTAIETVPFAQAQEWWTRGLGSAWSPPDKNRLVALQKHFKPVDKK